MKSNSQLRPRLNHADINFIIESLQLWEVLSKQRIKRAESLYDELKELHRKMQLEGPQQYYKRFQVVKEEYLEAKAHKYSLTKRAFYAEMFKHRFERLLRNGRPHFHLEPNNHENSESCEYTIT